jgi:hypothetical protein
MMNDLAREPCPPAFLHSTMRILRALSTILLCAVVLASPVRAQKKTDAARAALPSPDKIIADDFKIGGGFVMNIKGAGFVFERVRLAEAHWVPHFYHWNANGKGFLVMKRSVYETTEWTNFKRFRTDAGDAKIDAPKPKP